MCLPIAAGPGRDGESQNEAEKAGTEKWGSETLSPAHLFNGGTVLVT